MLRGETRYRVLFQRHAQTTGIVARGAIYLGMLCMFRRTLAGFWIVTISARYWVAVRTVALCAFPVLVHGRILLFRGDLKSVLPFVTMRAQFVRVAHGFVLLRLVVPK